jgi:hypothetical protein
MERANRAVSRYRDTLAGRRIFFFPDSQLEVPIARVLANELGMNLIEVGTPYLHRQHLAADLAMLPQGFGPAFPLQGRDALALGLPHGPRIGALLTETRDWWLETGASADHAACVEKLRQLAFGKAS